LTYRPSDRIKHKFKFKKADEVSHSFLKLMSELKDEEENEGQSNMEIQS
jgi:hypothetical protein